MSPPKPKSDSADKPRLLTPNLRPNYKNPTTHLSITSPLNPHATPRVSAPGPIFPLNRSSRPHASPPPPLSAERPTTISSPDQPTPSPSHTNPVSVPIRGPPPTFGPRSPISIPIRGLPSTLTPSNPASPPPLTLARPVSTSPISTLSLNDTRVRALPRAHAPHVPWGMLPSPSPASPPSAGAAAAAAAAVAHRAMMLQHRDSDPEPDSQEPDPLDPAYIPPPYASSPSGAAQTTEAIDIPPHIQKLWTKRWREQNQVASAAGGEREGGDGSGTASSTRSRWERFFDQYGGEEEVARVAGAAALGDCTGEGSLLFWMDVERGKGIEKEKNIAGERDGGDGDPAAGRGSYNGIFDQFGTAEAARVAGAAALGESALCVDQMLWVDLERKGKEKEDEDDGGKDSCEGGIGE